MSSNAAEKIKAWLPAATKSRQKHFFRHDELKAQAFFLVAGENIVSQSEFHRAIDKLKKIRLHRTRFLFYGQLRFLFFDNSMDIYQM